MKAIAIEITWYFIIGIAALVIGTSIFIFWKENLSNFFYCSLYTKLFQLQQIPEKCKIEEKIETVKIFSSNEKEVIKVFTSYLIKCWLDAERYNNLKTHYCFKIFFKNVTNLKIFPQNISKTLIDYDNCRTLQFKDYDCGYRNDIIWNVKNNYITEKDIVIIKYLETNQIEIIT